jgi:hypothetical protein
MDVPPSKMVSETLFYPKRPFDRLRTNGEGQVSEILNDRYYPGASENTASL